MRLPPHTCTPSSKLIEMGDLKWIFACLLEVRPNKYKETRHGQIRTLVQNVFAGHCFALRGETWCHAGEETRKKRGAGAWQGKNFDSPWVYYGVAKDPEVKGFGYTGSQTTI